MTSAIAKSRPHGDAIRNMLGIVEEPGKPQTKESELCARRDFYQLPPLQQTRSFKRIDGHMAEVDAFMERENEPRQNPCPRQRAIFRAAKDGDFEDAIRLALTELLAELELREDAKQEAELVILYASGRQQLSAAVLAAREPRRLAWYWPTCDNKRRQMQQRLVAEMRYEAIARAVVLEVACPGGKQSGRQRAAAIGVSSGDWRRHWAAPYEWAYESWHRALIDALTWRMA